MILQIVVLTSSLAFMQAGQDSHTPQSWLDTNLESIDRKAMEQMISFSPPPIPTDATWILPKNQKQFTWAGLLGKVVVIQSWSNKAANGRLALGATSKVISKQNTSGDVVLLTIHTPTGHNSAEQYLDSRSLEVPTIVDSTGELCNALGIYTYPTNIVIDRNGAVRHVGLRIRGVRAAIDALLETPFDPEMEVKPFVPTSDTIEVDAHYPTFSTSFGRAKDMQGKSAPTFVVQEWLSDPVDVEDKVRIVEFWATWCGPCRTSIPHLNELADHFGSDVAFVGVSNEDPSKIREFMKKTPMKYGVATDPQRRMQNEVACTAIPLAMVISSDGVVRWQGNPSRLTLDIVQQVLSADRGEGVSMTRGRWDTEANHG